MKKKVNLLNKRECVSSYVMLEGDMERGAGFSVALGRFIDKDLGPGIWDREGRRGKVPSGRSRGW